VGSCVRLKKSGLDGLDEMLALLGAGERGKTASSSEKTGVGGTKTGNVVVEGDGDGADAEGSEDDGDGALVDPWGKTGRRPAVAL
jgi:hypothetical protein